MLVIRNPAQGVVSIIIVITIIMIIFKSIRNHNDLYTPLTEQILIYIREYSYLLGSFL